MINITNTMNKCKFLELCQTNCNGSIEKSEVCECYRLNEIILALVKNSDIKQDLSELSCDVLTRSYLLRMQELDK